MLVAAVSGHAHETVMSPEYAVRWWNTLTPDEMVAALHGRTDPGMYEGATGSSM